MSVNSKEVAEVEETYPVVRNADNDSLGPSGGYGFIIGYVDEVNGRGAEEIQGFLATRHELIQLAKYWTTKAIDIEYWWFLYEQVGTSETRSRAFAWRRVSRIEEIVGKEEVDGAVKEAYDEYGKRLDAKAWNIFLNGTPEEREAFRKEIYAEMPK